MLFFNMNHLFILIYKNIIEWNFGRKNKLASHIFFYVYKGPRFNLLTYWLLKILKREIKKKRF